MATMEKDQFQSMTFPMLVSKKNYFLIYCPSENTGSPMLPFGTNVWSLNSLDQDHDVSELLHMFAVSLTRRHFLKISAHLVRFLVTISPTRRNQK